MEDRFVVLGSCGAWPEPKRACSGYLLSAQGFCCVLDLGYGTLSRLLDLTGSPAADGVDAVIVSHRHADHMSDLHGLFRARFFSRPSAAPIPLFGTPGVWETLSYLEGGDDEKLAKVFSFHELPARPSELGPFRLESIALTHVVANAGVRLVSDDLVVCYSGDTGPDERLVELGLGADLFVVEATDRPHASDDPDASHLRAEQAASAAARAGASRLLLTHFWPGTDREQSRARAEAIFDGELLIAEEGLEIGL